MGKMVKRAVLMTMVAIPLAASAQDKVEASLGADVVSGYVWRGQDLGNAAIQPSASVSYKGFSLGVWGSYGIVDSDDTKELDFTASWSSGGFTVSVTDYWFSGIEGCDRYFLYDAHRTAHVFEANVGYDFGKCSVNWYTNFAGSDYRPDGKRAYSSYIEVAAPFKLGGLQWRAAVGAVPFKSSSTYCDAAGNPVDGFAVTNVTLGVNHDIKITEHFSLPVFASVTANPNSQKMYLTFGLSL